VLVGLDLPVADDVGRRYDRGAIPRREDIAPREARVRRWTSVTELIARPWQGPWRPRLG
jgi:hypothetical protein